VATITALAGVNGAGKSSVTGSYVRSKGGAYFNPDEVAAGYRSENPALSQPEANSRAWRDGKTLLEAAIRDDTEFTFETTLGGKTIADLLEQAAGAGHRVRIVFVGLESAEKHIQRVASRVARGGHDIPEESIRERYRSSRLNLIRLLPVLDELVLYDNSDDADRDTGSAPALKPLLHMKDGRIVHIERRPNAACEWSKPILAAAVQHQLRS